jgi:hypothetical protein
MMKMIKVIKSILLSIAIILAAAVFLIDNAWAVPEVNSMRITDVTPASFSVVWMTDVNGMPEVAVYEDAGRTIELTDRLTITPMPMGSLEVVEAAREKGIMKVRVSGLSAGQRYYVRAVMRDPLNQESVGYSALKEVTTASETVPYRVDDTQRRGFFNDMSEFSVYVNPAVNDSMGGLGDLVLMAVEGAVYPVSAFVGDGILKPAVIIDLNNLYGADGWSLDVLGSERLELTVYRGEMLATLSHFRLLPADGALLQVREPVRGFFADLNLDHNVDDGDFEMFKTHYRAVSSDMSYNPDFDFVVDEEGVIDVREFSKFSQEYGRNGVE